MVKDRTKWWGKDLLHPRPREKGHQRLGPMKSRLILTLKMTYCWQLVVGKEGKLFQLMKYPSIPLPPVQALDWVVRRVADLRK